MPEKEWVIDYRSLIRLFLIVPLVYAPLWTIRYIGNILFGYRRSMQYGDPMSMLLVFWVPFLLLLIILFTLFFALTAEDGSKPLYPPIVVYAAITFGLTIHLVWLLIYVLTIGFH
jgi:hypothetical protein